MEAQDFPLAPGPKAPAGDPFLFNLLPIFQKPLNLNIHLK